MRTAATHQSYASLRRPRNAQNATGARGHTIASSDCITKKSTRRSSATATQTKSVNVSTVSSAALPTQWRISRCVLSTSWSAPINSQGVSNSSSASPPSLTLTSTCSTSRQSGVPSTRSTTRRSACTPTTSRTSGAALTCSPTR